MRVFSCQVWLQWHNYAKQRQASQVAPESTEEAVQAVPTHADTDGTAGIEHDADGNLIDSSTLPYVSVVMTHYNRPHLLKVLPYHTSSSVVLHGVYIACQHLPRQLFGGSALLACAHLMHSCTPAFCVVHVGRGMERLFDQTMHILNFCTYFVVSCLCFQ